MVNLVKLLLCLFILLNHTINGQNALYSIKKLNINFSTTQPKNLVKTSDYKPITNDSLKGIILEHLNLFLNKYPEELLSEAVKEIYVCNEFKFRGAYIGGNAYNEEQILVIAFNTNELNTPDYWYWMERLFHHELSHLIYHKFIKNFNQKKWKKENGVNYYSNKVSRKYTNTDVALDTNLLQHGFINQYSRHNIKEDFAVYAEYMFTPDAKFKKEIKNYTRSNNKYKMMVDFFNKIDTSYTDAYFEKLR